MPRRGKPADTHDVIDALNDMIELAADLAPDFLDDGYDPEDRKRINAAKRVLERAMKFGTDIEGARGS